MMHRYWLGGIIHNMRYFLLFSCLVLWWCFQAYHQHFVAEYPEFSSDTVVSQSVSSSGTLLSFPYTKKHAILVEKIQKARSKIWLEIYMWTYIDDVVNAMINAHKRWIDVRVLLEWSVYGMPTINNKVARKIKDAGIPLYYSDPERYTFTHAKFWIIDDQYFISTGNWTKSFFSKNREYIFQGNDTTILGVLSDIFEADTKGIAYKNPKNIPPELVVSPIDSRQKIIDFLKTTKRQSHIFVQTISDPELLQFIEDSPHAISICTAENTSNKKSKIRSHRTWKFAKKPYLHAKVVLVDTGSVFIWSQNFTTNAFNNNREIGIILRDRPDIVSTIQAHIQKDCK